MQKEVVETYPKEKLAVYVVWVPMIQGDGERAARKASVRYRDPRVSQFYDGGRLSGIAFARQWTPRHFRALLDALPAEHFLRERVAEMEKEPPEEHPAWDVVYFFPPGARWGEVPPEAPVWSKQFAFFGEPEGEAASGLFFRHDLTMPPRGSDWFLEVRAAMKTLLTRPAR